MSSSASSRDGRTGVLHLALTIALLALGWWLRTASVEAFSHLLHHDEAWYALNAVDLIADPRFVTFFPENNGRESGWMYVLAGWISLLGRDIASLRLLAAFVGLLTLAAVYRLGRELFDRWAGLGALAALSVLFWHVMISSHIVRLNFALLLVALAALGWARALRRGGAMRWARAGLLTGALAYSYFAAWGILAFLLLGGLILAVFRPEQRRGIALAWGAAVLVILPQFLYATTHTFLFTTRSTTVARFEATTLLANVLAWLRAWWIQGDLDDHYNLSGRAILGLTGSVVLMVGILAASFDAWRARHTPGGALAGFVVLAGLGIALAPSLVTADAPSFSRGAMALIPLGLLLGLGLSRIGLWLATRWPGVRGLKFAPLPLLIPLAVSGYRDLHGAWIDFARRTAFMEAPLIYGFERAASTPTEQPVYFSPFTPTHPVVRYLSPLLAPRPVGAFDSHQCLVLAAEPATYFSLSAFEDVVAAHGPWSTIVERERRDDLAGALLLEASPSEALRARLAEAPEGVIADRLKVWVLALSNPTPAPGETVTLTVALQMTGPATAPLGVFVHAYGDPTPYAGGRMWAQTDAGLCDSYPPTVWRADETIVQSLALTFPADLAAGSYELVFGAYTYPDITRLPITAPDPALPHVVLHSWSVPEP